MLLWMMLAIMAPPAIEHQSVAAPSAIIDHIGLYVADPAKSASFYQRTLGLRLLPQNASPNMRWLGSATFQLHLIGGRTKPVDKTSDTHFAFRVRDLRDEIKVLDQERIPWADSDGAPRKITRRFDGVLQIYFLDPDGYSIEVNQAAK